MSEFTLDPQAFWDNIAPHVQHSLLANVWCACCHDATTIVGFGARMDKGKLLLRGRCESCGSDVARVIEGLHS